jgi:8-oxo-dGTP pyrophosphatase MutT (NUDIX family)
MRWTVHGERTLYDSDWVRLALADVELPSGDRYEHHVVRISRPAAAAVMRRDGEILLLWRHRMVTDSWGWEVPAGRADPGESPEEAAAREAVEETGWRPRSMRRLGSFHPMPGLVEQTFHVFVADGADRVGEPSDTDEAERVEWLPEASVREFLRDGSIGDGFSLVALHWALAS